MTPDLPPPPLVSRTVYRLPASASQASSQPDSIATEVPVALVFNGISHAVMMATPQDLESFALGFALSEGILDSAADCYGIDIAHTVVQAVDSFEVQLEVSSHCFNRLKIRRRSLVGATGCGLCGVDSLAALDLAVAPLHPSAWLADLQPEAILNAIRRAMHDMPARQVLNSVCGSLHAAGWASPQGLLGDVMEDVGRHNALDKLLGLRARNGPLHEACAPGFVVMSSRASYELVRKCARLKVPLLATISAPTDLAIQLAQAAGIQLWGLCRGDSANRYSA